MCSEIFSAQFFGLVKALGRNMHHISLCLPRYILLQIHAYYLLSKATEKNDLSPSQTATDDLLRLVKPQLPNATELPEFFWHHLERDLQLLGQATGKSVDEAAIILHLVLRGILTQEPPKGISSLNFV